MWPDRVSNPGPLTYESGALLTALCGPARKIGKGEGKSREKSGSFAVEAEWQPCREVAGTRLELKLMVVIMFLIKVLKLRICSAEASNAVYESSVGKKTWGLNEKL